MDEFGQLRGRGVEVVEYAIGIPELMKGGFTDGAGPGIDSYSAFFENDYKTPTGLTGYLRERDLDDLYFVGLAYDFCVAWSAIDAAKLGFRATVIEAATRAIDLNGSREAARANMRKAGVELA